MRSALTALLLLTASGSVGCKHLFRNPPDKTRCPEYRDLVCVGVVECSMNHERGCRECQCGSIMPGGQDGQPPDRRIPDPGA